MPAHISELSYNGSEDSDFIEIAVEAGTDVSGYSIYIYNADGEIEDGPFSLGTAQSTTNGNDVYVIDEDDSEFDGLNSEYSIALVDDTGDVVQFVSFEGNTVTGEEGPAQKQTSTDIGGAKPEQSLQSDDGGASYYTQAAPNPGIGPCYAPGTLIGTPDGPRPVETLAVGDLVETLDSGPAQIRWLRKGEQPLVGAPREDCPVLIRACSFGAGRPTRDLIVSPQHRILVGGHGQLERWFGRECFAPAKALTSLAGIRAMAGKRRISWYHFALDRHAVVTANGCYSELLLLGPMVLNGLTGLQRRALTASFGPVSAGRYLNGPPARDCLTVGAARRALGVGHGARKAA